MRSFLPFSVLWDTISWISRHMRWIVEYVNQNLITICFYIYIHCATNTFILFSKIYHPLAKDLSYKIRIDGTRFTRCVLGPTVMCVWILLSVAGDGFGDVRHQQEGIYENRQTPGPWFNIKMTSYQYRKSHCGDKTILRPSYLHNGISYIDKMTSLYWIKAQ